MPFPPTERDAAGEAAAFEALKGRLAGLWEGLFPGDDEHYTSVVVPSRPVGPEGWGTDYEEERLLFLLIRLRNPRARMVYVTSRPIPPPVLEYYFELLRGTPASHLRAHLHLLSVHDTTPRPLAAKILERPGMLARIRAAVFDPARAYLTVGESSPLERRLAVALDLPLNAADPALAGHATGAGARRIFREAGLDVPQGVEGVRSAAETVDALVEIARRGPHVRRAVVRLDGSRTAATVAYPPGPPSRSALERAVRTMEPSEPGLSADAFLARLAAVGAVVEERIEGDPVASAELRINPRRQVVAASTHDHLAEGTGGLWFPAAPDHRLAVMDAGRRAAEALAACGIVSRVSVKFAVRPGASGHTLTALGMDLGMGPVVHSVLALRFLTEGSLDAETGAFLTPSGAPKSYRSNDALRAERYRGLLPEDLIDVVAAHRLRFDPLSESGVLFHVIGGLSERGSIGLTAVGSDRAEADRHYQRAVRILDEASAQLLRAPHPPA
jgi:PGM1 C-terminal domain